jgi:hypothetical protein
MRLGLTKLAHEHVTVLDENDLSQTVQVSLGTAITLRLITLNAEWNSVINNMNLGQSIEVKRTTVIPHHEVCQRPIRIRIKTNNSRAYKKLAGRS